MEATKLVELFLRASKDQRMTGMHLFIYVGLLLLAVQKGVDAPLSISRRQVMLICKIKGLATYHKYINDLQLFGYIKYFPSYHPKIGSWVYFNQ